MVCERSLTTFSRNIFPSATLNPSLDPLMHEGPVGNNLWTGGSTSGLSSSTNGGYLGVNSPRLRIPIERR